MQQRHVSACVCARHNPWHLYCMLSIIGSVFMWKFRLVLGQCYCVARTDQSHCYRCPPKKIYKFNCFGTVNCVARTDQSHCYRCPPNKYTNLIVLGQCTVKPGLTRATATAVRPTNIHIELFWDSVLCSQDWPEPLLYRCPPNKYTYWIVSAPFKCKFHLTGHSWKYTVYI